MSQSTISQLCQSGSSWVEPVLSKDKCVLLKMLVRLEPVAPQSRVKYSTTEPLCSLNHRNIKHKANNVDQDQAAPSEC